MSTTPAGYTGTPLPGKLGIFEGCPVVTKHAPNDYAPLLHSVPTGVVFGKKVSKATDNVHVLSDKKSALKTDLVALRKSIWSVAVVWVSWPKQAAKIPMNITEDTVREQALPLGFVDIEVCALNEIWSGLKLVVRKGLR